jgi:hypothetical protein
MIFVSKWRRLVLFENLQEYIIQFSTKKKKQQQKIDPPYQKKRKIMKIF